MWHIITGPQKKKVTKNGWDTIPLKFSSKWQQTQNTEKHSDKAYLPLAHLPQWATADGHELQTHTLSASPDSPLHTSHLPDCPSLSPKTHNSINKQQTNRDPANDCSAKTINK